MWYSVKYKSGLSQWSRPQRQVPFRGCTEVASYKGMQRADLAPRIQGRGLHQALNPYPQLSFLHFYMFLI